MACLNVFIWRRGGCQCDCLSPAHDEDGWFADVLPPSWKFSAHAGCSASHLSCRTDGISSFAPFRLKTKTLSIFPFANRSSPAPPNLLVNSIKWPPPPPPPRSSLCCAICNNVTFLCCFKWSHCTLFGKRVNAVLCYTGPPFGLFSHTTWQLGELRGSKWDCESAY